MKYLEETIKKLEEKWGKFEKDNRFYKQCNLPNFSPRNYLNVLFEPIEKELMLRDKGDDVLATSIKNDSKRLDNQSI